MSTVRVKGLIIDVAHISFLLAHAHVLYTVFDLATTERRGILTTQTDDGEVY